MRRILLTGLVAGSLCLISTPAWADSNDICQPGVTVNAPALGGQSLTVAAAPALSPVKCLATPYEVVVVNTTTGATLDDQTLLPEQQYSNTFALARGSSLSATITQGQGTASASGGIMAVAPAAPGGLVAASATQTSVSLQWQAPADDGGSAITNYVITWPGGSAGATDTQAVVSGLTAGTSYTFAVAAVNGIGTGDQATVTASTSAKPAPPGPGPAPSPQPAVIAPAVPGNGGNTNGTHDADGNPATIQQTTTARWPGGRLASGKPGKALASSTLVTNAGQPILLAVTAVSPSIEWASVVYNAARHSYHVVATLKPHTVSGSVTVTALASATTAGTQAFEPLQASRLYVVKPA